jgi:hypothetical protein
MDAREESGQALLEFLLLLPFMIGLSIVLVRANTVVQMSIVNQQYARSQTLNFLSQNSPYYPSNRLQASLLAKKTNQMVVGVSENNTATEDDAGAYVPLASTYRITRQKDANANDTAQESDKRSLVRVRNTISMCTQPIVAKIDGQVVKFTGDVKEIKNPTAFLYCTSQVEGLETLR